MKGFMKKSFSIFFVFVFLLCGFTLNNKVHAAGDAPPVTEFYIMGYSWPELFSQGLYYSSDAASSVPVPDSTAYLIVYQMGYGSLSCNYYKNMSTYASYPITDSNNVVIGFIRVISISNLPEGLDTINLGCSSYSMPWNTMTDSIQLNIEPNTSDASLQSENSLGNTLKFSSLGNLKK